ncbi:MAG TPA: hypothetical protein VD997_07070 [Phycisphaerales bacterium]|nr:hypothetical protein [Phycisphaerales bacterium]
MPLLKRRFEPERLPPMLIALAGAMVPVLARAHSKEVGAWVGRHWYLWVPVFLVPWVWAVRRYLRAKSRSEQGARYTCHACGYDLVAHVRGERCPECGAPFRLP